MSWIADEIKDFTNREVYKATHRHEKYGMFQRFISILESKYDVSLRWCTKDGTEVSIETNERLSTMDFFDLEENIKELKDDYSVEIVGGALEVSRGEGTLRKGLTRILRFSPANGSLSFYTKCLEDERIKNLVDKIASEKLKVPRQKEKISTVSES